MAPPKGGKKRAADPVVIDLTSSSPVQPDRQFQLPVSRKNPKTTHHTHHTQSSQPSSYLASSQAQSSQRNPSFHQNIHSDITIPDEFFSDDDDWVADDLEVNPTQNYQNAADCLYGALESKIVGVRFYNGYVTSNEHVLVRREPNNPYDSNAIQILNVQNQQIGHIPKTIAAKLAPFMDQNTLRIEAITRGPKGDYDCPLLLQFFGSSDPSIRARVKEQMKDKKLPVSGLSQLEREEAARKKEFERQQKEREKLLKKAKAAVVGNGNGGQWGSGTPEWAGSSMAALEQAPNLEDIMRESEKFNPRNFDEMAEKFSLGEDYLKNMPMAKQPAGIKSQLLPYQLQGLQWLLNKESPQVPAGNNSVQLWKRSPTKPGYFTHLATNFSYQGSPQLASGGILADDMGLGKTIQVLSLIIADRELAIPKGAGVSAASLIVAPLSVMSNWVQQAERHIHEHSALKILVYHGSKRAPLNPKTVEGYDLVVTTYDTIRSEHFGKNAHNREKSGLGAITWRRIILDEGHIIRNPAAKTSTAVCALKAQSRWSLTGTPIINSLKDLYSLVRFMRLTGGINQWELFNGAIIRPLNAGLVKAGENLQALMNSICLRRKKDMQFIDLKLPELSEYIHRIDFHPHESEQYDALSAEATGTLEDYRRARGKSGVDASKAYRNLLEVLLRMRQLCNHWQLVGKARLKELEIKEGQCLDLTPENRELLQKMLQLNIEAQEDCPVCLDSMTDPVISMCSHIFCYNCIEKVIETQHKCPMCRAKLDDVSQLLRPAKEETDDKPAGMQFTETSSKVEALISILQACDKNKANKTVVFSQWTSFLDVIGIQVAKTGIRFVEITGKMSASQRDAAMAAFEKDPEVTVLLASLAVCSVGLNLVSANCVILADSWWAPAIEDQAVDRVHRLGQKRACTVYRLVMTDSIEEKVLEIQKRKRQLMMLALSEKKAKRGNERTHTWDEDGIRDVVEVTGSGAAAGGNSACGFVKVCTIVLCVLMGDLVTMLYRNLTFSFEIECLLSNPPAEATTVPSISGNLPSYNLPTENAEAGTPPDPIALQNYHEQLKLLEKQNVKRVACRFAREAMQSEEQEGSVVKEESGGEMNYQEQLNLAVQQNEKLKELMIPASRPSVGSYNFPFPMPDDPRSGAGRFALQDHQMQFMLSEQQRKKKELDAYREKQGMEHNQGQADDQNNTAGSAMATPAGGEDTEASEGDRKLQNMKTRLALLNDQHRTAMTAMLARLNLDNPDQSGGLGNAPMFAVDSAGTTSQQYPMIPRWQPSEMLQSLSGMQTISTGASPLINPDQAARKHTIEEIETLMNAALLHMGSNEKIMQAEGEPVGKSFTSHGAWSLRKVDFSDNERESGDVADVADEIKIKITSPVFTDIGDQDWHSPIKQVFKSLDTKMRGDIQCPMHVHISPASGEWSLTDLQKLSCCALYFKESLELLLPNGLSPHFPESRPNESWKLVFDEILSSKTIAELVRLMNPKSSAVLNTERYFAWSFTNLDGAGDNKTVEFRHAPGIRNGEIGVGWISVLMMFVRASLSVEDPHKLINSYSQTDLEGLKSFLTPSLPKGVAMEEILGQEWK
ncbi:hypothetical protein BT63DRAFT_437066 [Microthyrium microscopicum]|uniref:SNF2 family helicase n=1 Tax=Microthyrium microscopicum TaxID=703497 RepID=A0A6A6UM77_9PEZI|nr:hypothetical protein BT63DRAFT_437066 [Microthyrium microscopicum]